MAMRDGPDDVLRAERRVAAEEDVRDGGLERHLVEDWKAPLIKFNPAVALDPGERVLLADRDEDVVALEVLVGLAGGDEVAAAFVVVHGLHFFEGHAGKFSTRNLEGFWH